MSPVVVKEKGKAEKRKKDEKEKTNNETETVTPPAKQVSIYTSGKKCVLVLFLIMYQFIQENLRKFVIC